MALEWYEWECPACKRIGQVNPACVYRSGDSLAMCCPHCKSEVMVVCVFEPTFIAYRIVHGQEE